MNRVILLGWPVSHSLSPRLHAAGFADRGLADWEYEARGVPPADLEAAWSEIVRDADVRGGNLTVPHKTTVLPWLSSVEDAARSIGAVNTFVSNSDGVRGFNTDVDGVAGALDEHGVDLKGREGWVLGAGGAARAVVAALFRTGLGRLRVAARSVEKADALLVDLEMLRPSSVDVAVVPFNEVRGSVVNASLVINATSIGLGASGRLPCELPPTDSTTNERWAFDCVYGTESTPWLDHADSQGWRTIDGRGMLLHQALRAFSLWTGIDAPAEAMRRALTAH